MDISVVIINFHTFDLVRNCIASIQNFTLGITYEIIVVDNSKSITEEEKFKELLPEINYINSNENLGFGRANNLGFSHANGRYILVLNSDTIFIENSLRYCMDFMQSTYAKEKKIGMVGCKLLNEDLTFQHSFFPFTNNNIWTYFKCSNPILYKFLCINRKYCEPKKTPIEVGDISGAYMFLERSILEKTKGFDPDFFMYCEDTEWCRDRIRKICRIYYLPSTSVIHLGGKSAPKRLMFIQNILSLSLMWYKKGIFNYISYIILSYLNVVTYAFTHLLVGKQQKKFSRQYLIAYLKTIHYHIFQIPNTTKTHQPLVYDPLKKLFFNENHLKGNEKKYLPQEPNHIA